MSLTRSTAVLAAGTLLVVVAFAAGRRSAVTPSVVAPPARPAGSAPRPAETATAHATKLAAEVPARAPSTVSPPGSALETFRVWLRSSPGDKRASLKRAGLWNPDFEALYYRATASEYPNLRELIDGALADPRPFIEFARAPENDAIVGFLFAALNPLKGELPERYATMIQPFNQFPDTLMSGVLDMLKSGTLEQKKAGLRFTEHMVSLPSSFTAAQLSLIDDSDPVVKAGAIEAVAGLGHMPPERTGELVRTAETTSLGYLRRSCYLALGRLGTPEAEACVLSAVENPPDSESMQTLGYAVTALVRRARPESADRYARALTTALSGENSKDSFRSFVQAALYLTVSAAVPVLERARGRAPTQELNVSVDEILKLAGSGETRPHVLRRVLDPTGTDE